MGPDGSVCSNERLILAMQVALNDWYEEMELATLLKTGKEISVPWNLATIDPTPSRRFIEIHQQRTALIQEKGGIGGNIRT